MFCRHCGAQIPDGAKFCGSCGNPVESSVNNNDQENASKTSTEYNKTDYSAYSNASAPQHTGGFSNKHKLVIGIVAIAAAVAVILILLFTVGGFGKGGGGGSTPQATIQRLEDAFNDDINISEIAACFEETSDYDFKELENTISGTVSAIKALGVSYHFDIEIEDIETYTDNGTDYANVSIDFEASYSMMGYDDSDSTDMDIKMVKVGNEWKISADDSTLGEMFG